MFEQTTGANAKAVLVTGATRGIGRAVVDLLVARGSQVVGVGRDWSNTEIPAGWRHNVTTVNADLLMDINWGGVVAQAVEALGALDGLVNCAGIIEYEPLEQISAASMRRQLQLNLQAPLMLAQHFAQHVRSRRRPASLVNVSSTLALRPIAATAVYAAAKAGLNALTKALAIELGADRIRVNAVLPGVIDTDMIRGLRSSNNSQLSTEQRAEATRQQLEGLKKAHPLGRLGKTMEIAATILHVLDSEWMTGSLIVHDGGVLL